MYFFKCLEKLFVFEDYHHHFPLYPKTPPKNTACFSIPQETTSAWGKPRFLVLLFCSLNKNMPQGKMECSNISLPPCVPYFPGIFTSKSIITLEALWCFPWRIYSFNYPVFLVIRSIGLSEASSARYTQILFFSKHSESQLYNKPHFQSLYLEWCWQEKEHSSRTSSRDPSL